MSPKLPQLPHDVDTSSGESPTHFKADLLRYLSAYRLPQVQEWLTKIRNADFSSIRYAFSITSALFLHISTSLYSSNYCF